MNKHRSLSDGEKSDEENKGLRRFKGEGVISQDKLGATMVAYYSRISGASVLVGHVHWAMAGDSVPHLYSFGTQADGVFVL